ncbi:MAG: RluA family pseudouridine synthase [Alphaproteobacteria bacterium]|nr:RluA family pseudouridine synthase [Alphaproteobacteria bacterium]
MSGAERVVVDAARASVRLDKLLAGLASVGSREKARQALRTGKVSVDGREVGEHDGGKVLGEGAVVEIAWNRPGTGARRVEGQRRLERAGVQVVHVDEQILVADKPPGLLTDAADADQHKHRDTLRKRVRAYLQVPEVWPAHRIDRDTSGLVLFARTEAVREHLLTQWHARSPHREYRVVVEGRWSRRDGRQADWMRWDASQRLQRPCGEHDAGAWLAEADVEVLERFGDRATLLGVRLVTGRRNQIRLQTMLAGHPLIGEPLYRKRPPTILFTRQALHAFRLGFVHPGTNEPVTWEAPLPADLGRLLASLRT